MIKTAIAAATFVVYAAINPAIMTPDGSPAPASLSAKEKTAILHPLIETATACVAEAVRKHPQRGKDDVTDLIVMGFKQCVEPVRAMIDAHDRYYGAGSGEHFFMGPYLDALPAAVTSIVEKSAR